MPVTEASGVANRRCDMAVLLVGAVLTLLPGPSPAISLEQKEPAVPSPTTLPAPSPPVIPPSQEEMDVRSLSAQGALRKGLWNRAMAESAAILAGGSPDLQAVGVLAVAAAVLGDERTVNTGRVSGQELRILPYHYWTYTGDAIIERNVEDPNKWPMPTGIVYERLFKLALQRK